MNDCTESQEVEQCSSDMARCGEMYAHKEDDDFFAKACLFYIAKMDIMKRGHLIANYTAVKKTSVTERYSKSVS